MPIKEGENRSRDEFLIRLGRELRGPLAPICNALYLLRRHPDEATVVLSAQEILDRQVRHLVHLVDDLLDMSRLAQGELALQREDVDLRRISEEVGDGWRASFAAADLLLDIALPSAPLWVRGDGARLAQVLGHLLDNALQFTPPGGRVSLGLEADAARDEAVLRIADSGAGVDPEQLPHLFDRFPPDAPAGTASARRIGLGLGLAVVGGLVELHEGTIEAASAGRGKGVAFTIRLPRAPEREDPRIGPAAAARAARPLRVVIIEDDRDTAESLCLLLELLGHQVTIALTGERGIAAVREIRPDVVLCDIGLPDVDGFEVARTLHSDPATAGCPLVAITGYGREEDRRQAAAAGFAHHLVKPVDPDKLFELLAEYAGQVSASAPEPVAEDLTGA
jgi:CheY-like chemotaxis protein